MGIIKGLCKFWIVSVNSLFLLIGLLIFTLGLILRFGESIIDKYIEAAKQKVTDVAALVGGNQPDLSALDMTKVLSDVSLGLIFFGVFIVIVSVLGCCGSCCSISTCLGLYLTICVALFLAQIAAVSIVYGKPEWVHNRAKDALKEGITNDYKGSVGSNLNSMAWNLIMSQLKCCGVDGYTDFTSATWTLKTTLTLLAPLTCCKTPAADGICAQAGTLDVYNEGCYPKIWEMTLGNAKIMGFSLSIVGVFQLSFIVMGAYLLKESKKDKKKQKKKNRVGPSSKA